jgi:hypothetical protein
VIDHEVVGTVPVSAALQDLPLREALKTVLTPQALFARVDGPSLVVYTFEARGWTISLPVVTLSASTSITNETGATVANMSETSTRRAPRRAPGQPTTRIVSISTWTDLETAVKTIASRDATVTINPALGPHRRPRPSGPPRSRRRVPGSPRGRGTQQIAVEVRAFEVTVSDSYS